MPTQVRFSLRQIRAASRARAAILTVADDDARGGSSAPPSRSARLPARRGHRFELGAEAEQQPVVGDRRARREKEDDAVSWGVDLLLHLSVKRRHPAE